jgi:hypothetical protein
MMFRDARDAYKILADPEVKAEYDRVFWLRYNREKADMDVPVKPAIVDLSHSISREVSDYFARFGWHLPRLSSFQRRMALTAVAVVLATGIAGTSLAFARPENAIASPFRGAAMTVAEIASGAVSIIDYVGAFGSASERQIISTTLQLMRIKEHVMVLSPVDEPTNDMAVFPSKEHSLYPGYVDRRYSQFEYTVDSNGIVTVHTESATTSEVLDRIKQMIASLE